MPKIYLVCEDCTGAFYWTEVDQEFYAKNHYAPPKRCYKCRQSRKQKKVSGEIQQAFNHDVNRLHPSPVKEDQNDFGIRWEDSAAIPIVPRGRRMTAT